MASLRPLHYLKVSLAKLLTAPAIGRVVGHVYKDRMPCRGLVIDACSDFISPHAKAKLFWGLYESAEIRYVENYLSSERDVIELGSSIGVLSCFIKRRIGPQRKLICVEAHPDLGAMIRRNMEINNLDTNFEIVNALISSSSQTDQTESFIAASENTSGRTMRLGDSGTSNVIQVSSLSLSDLVRDHAISEYSLVSDIEGAEESFILSDAHALDLCRQIIIELHSTVHEGRVLSVQDLVDVLVRIHGFKIKDRRGPVLCFVK